jgi:ABC-type lipoprotein release transport system permease subunit
MRGLVYGVGTTDPVTYVALAVVLFSVVVLASLIPAWRATQVDAMAMLRSE